MNIQQIYPVTTADKVANVTDVTGTLSKETSHTLSEVLTAMHGAYNKKEVTPAASDTTAWSAAGNHITFGGLSSNETYAEKSAYDLLYLILCPEIGPYCTGSVNVTLNKTSNTEKWYISTDPTDPSLTLSTNDRLTFYNCQKGSYTSADTSFTYDTLTTETKPTLHRSVSSTLFTYIYTTQLATATVTPSNYSSTPIITSAGNLAKKYFTTAAPNTRIVSNSGQTTYLKIETDTTTLKPVTKTVDEKILYTYKVPHIIYKSKEGWKALYLKYADYQDGNWIFEVPGEQNEVDSRKETAIYISPCCEIDSVYLYSSMMPDGASLDIKLFTTNVDMYTKETDTKNFNINNDGTVTEVTSENVDQLKNVLAYTKYSKTNLTALSEVTTSRIKIKFKNKS